MRFWSLDNLCPSLESVTGEIALSRNKGRKEENGMAPFKRRTVMAEETDKENQILQTTRWVEIVICITVQKVHCHGRRDRQRKSNLTDHTLG